MLYKVENDFDRIVARHSDILMNSDGTFVIDNYITVPYDVPLIPVKVELYVMVNKYYYTMRYGVTLRGPEVPAADGPYPQFNQYWNNGSWQPVPLSAISFMQFSQDYEAKSNANLLIADTQHIYEAAGEDMKTKPGEFQIFNTLSAQGTAIVDDQDLYEYNIQKQNPVAIPSLDVAPKRRFFKQIVYFK